jgi:predicted TIM-barrel fold metal-dependent hydrolase
MISRRRLLSVAALGAGASLVLPGRQSLRAQTGAKRLIVDAQVHMWSPNTAESPWISGFTPQLPEPMSIERILPMMDEAGVDRVVVVPSVNIRDDYGLEAVRRDPQRFAVMGRLPLTDPQSATLLPTWKDRPGMLGLRASFFTRESQAEFAEGKVDWLWPAAEKARIPVMFLAYGFVSKFAPIAERHPGLNLIVDHLGVSNAMAREGKLAQGIADVVALARYPNVSVKLSNLVNASLEPYPFRDLNDHLQRVVAAFGPQRCHWGTDLTLSFTRATWRQRLTHITEELKFLSETDKDWIMGRSILQLLNWA